MKPAVDEMFPEGAGPYVDLDEVGSERNISFHQSKQTGCASSVGSIQLVSAKLKFAKSTSNPIFKICSYEQFFFTLPLILFCILQDS